MNRIRQYLSSGKHIVAVSCLCVCAAVMLIVSLATPPASPPTVYPEAPPAVSVAPVTESERSEAESTVSDTLSVGANGFGLYIDDLFVCACAEGKTINTALEELLECKIASLAVKNVHEKRIINSVELRPGTYEPAAFADASTLRGLLGTDTGFLLTDIYGKPVATNISVLAATRETVDETLEYDIENRYTDTERDGYTKVLTEGVTGLRRATYSCIYLDGELLQSSLDDELVIAEPTDEIRLVGTKAGGMQVASLGGFLDYPYPDGRVTSGYGNRELDGMHDGIDIVALSGNCYGDDVFASAAGVVEFAGVANGYGNTVTIRHNDEVQTLYAHMSVISVKEGDTVSQGQKIGEIGSTGFSTGPHLHFEVIIGGENVDPERFLEY